MYKIFEEPRRLQVESNLVPLDKMSHEAPSFYPYFTIVMRMKFTQSISLKEQKYSVSSCFDEKVKPGGGVSVCSLFFGGGEVDKLPF